MSSTNKTTNYELSQFISTDKPTWLVDYNTDMNKIDLAIKGVSDVANTNTNNITLLTGRMTSAENNIVNLQASSSQQGSDITDLKAQDIVTNNRLTSLENKNIFNLLWTNANPSSIFEEASISVDTSNYSYIVVEFLLSVNGEYSFMEIINKEFPRYRMISHVGAGILSRDIVGMTANSITFSKCQIYPRGGGAPSLDSQYLIPYKVYGIE